MECLKLRLTHRIESGAEAWPPMLLMLSSTEGSTSVVPPMSPPMSLPLNLPGYMLIPELSDEFDGATLNTSKWSTDREVLGWAGRAPGLFDPANVIVAGGSLQLWARASARNATWPAGFEEWRPVLRSLRRPC